MEYLNSLSEDTEEIDVSNEDLTSLDVTRFKNLKTLNCSYNQLTFLYLPETLQKLYCYDNQLTSLHLPETLKILYCSHNQLTSLHLPETLQKLYCHYNQLTSLHLPETLQELNCSGNQLTSLHLNEQIKKLYCYHNQLTSLRLNENLQEISCSNNPIYEILNSNKELIKQLRVLNQFCHLYYCLKFKKQFRDLLWVKIREPKIRIKYSHDYLVANLHEETDLDELLNKW
jgi:Leucine-rich repeat (LRR) protein